MPWHSALFSGLWHRRDRLPHALLIHGQKGIGKLQFAASLAEALLCETPAASGACGACRPCNWLATGFHPDFRRLEPLTAEDAEEEGAPAKKGTQIIVEQVRALSEFLNVTTHRGGWRPVLVHPAEALNASAANALLKSLEEPPPHTLFILITHRLHQVLPTIKSRCQLVPLPAPARAEATAWLQRQGVANSELAAAHSGGAPLIAMELDAEQYWNQRQRFVRYLTATSLNPLAAAEDAQEAGIPLVLEWLQKWTYDLAAVKLGGNLRYNIDQEGAIGRLAAGSDALRILRYHRDLVRMQRHAHHPLNARLALEQLMMGYADAVTARPSAS